MTFALNFLSNCSAFRWNYITALAVLWLGIAGGCSNKEQSKSTTLPYAGASVSVGVPADWGFESQWEIQTQEWSARTGGQAQYLPIDYRKPDAQPWDETQKPSVVIFPWTRLGDYLADDRLGALPGTALEPSELDWQDVLAGVREKVATLESGPELIPISLPVLVCYYRADLLEKAGQKPPETWEEYETLARDVAQWAPGLTVWEPWSPDFRATWFLARTLAYAQHPGHYSLLLDIDSATPLLTQPGFQKGLEVAWRTFANLDPKSVEADPWTCREAVLTGKAALAIGLEPAGPTGGWPLSVARPEIKSPVKRAENQVIGIVRLPGAKQSYNLTTKVWDESAAGINQPTLVGFGGLCAAVSKRNIDTESAAALNLLGALLLDDTAGTVPGSRTLCRESQTSEPANWAGVELSPAEAGAHAGIVARSLRDRTLVVDLPLPERAQFRALLTNALDKLLVKQATPEQTLAEMDREWTALIQKIGAERVKTTYRKALGLRSSSDLLPKLAP